jgi:hypothetical protein
LGVPKREEVEWSPAEGIGKLKSQKPGGEECWTYYVAVEAGGASDSYAVLFKFPRVMADIIRRDASKE